MPPPRRRTFRKRLQDEGESILIELIQLIGFILVLWAGEALVRWTVGDVLLFGKFPMRWLFDAGHIGMVCCFTFRVCRQLLGK
jgi:hypothetical protein